MIKKNFYDESKLLYTTLHAFTKHLFLGGIVLKKQMMDITINDNVAFKCLIAC